MASSSSNKRTSEGRTGDIRRPSDLNRQAGDDSGEPQEYYTGGKKSGMLVQDPTKVNHASAIFNQARQFGAVEIHANVPHPYSSSHANVPHPYSNSHANVPHPYSNSNSFTRIGRLLSGEAVSSAAQQRIVVTHNIVFWRNGFRVDNGPFRRLDDPQNASFLESIRKSERPKELEPTDRRIAAVYVNLFWNDKNFTAVHVNLFRMENDFPEPGKRRRTLGSASGTKPMEAAASLNTAPPPSMGLAVDYTSPSTGGIHTLSGLNHQARNGGFNEPQEYYTGGTESGLVVQDPFKANSRGFIGTRRLFPDWAVSYDAGQPAVIIHNIVLWSNGFMVDGGSFRRLDDPENASFLESIKKSECPKEFEPANTGIAVRVNVMMTGKEFTEPEKHHVPFQSHIPFQGAGRTLGRTSSSSPTPMEADASASVNTAPPPAMGVIVDNTSPSTSIQVRLADGTRVVSRFNYHHTVRDIRAFIDAIRPSGDRSYELQAVGFPPKQLTDLEQTIEQAGLAKSVVIQN